MLLLVCVLKPSDKILTLYLCVYYPVAEDVLGSPDLDSGRDSLLMCQISLKKKRNKQKKEETKKNISEHLY